MNHQLIENLGIPTLYEGVAMEERAKEGLKDLLLKINERLIRYHLSTLVPQPIYHMKHVVDEIDGQIVEAKTRKLSARYTFDSDVTDLSPELREAVAEELVNAIVDEIAYEIAHEMSVLAREHKQFCPYVLATSSGIVIDPMTFSPVLSFMIRYGVCDVAPEVSTATTWRLRRYIPDLKIQAPSDHILVQNVYDVMSRDTNPPGYSAQAATTKLLGEIAQVIVEKHISQIIPDEANYIGPDKTLGGEPIEIIRDRYVAKWTFECAQDAAAGVDIEAELREILAREVGQEIAQKIVDLSQENKQFCPYLILHSGGVVLDPQTFEPMVPFYYEYGVREITPEEARANISRIVDKYKVNHIGITESMEQTSVAAPKTEAPKPTRLTEDYIESRIVSTNYHVDGTLTIAIVEHQNGFKAVGTSACVDPANYSQELGETLARKRAVEKLWEVEGFHLAERLANPEPAPLPQSPYQGPPRRTRVFYIGVGNMQRAKVKEYIDSVRRQAYASGLDTVNYENFFFAVEDTESRIEVFA